MARLDLDIGLLAGITAEYEAEERELAHELAALRELRAIARQVVDGAYTPYIVGGPAGFAVVATARLGALSDAVEAAERAAGGGA